MKTTAVVIAVLLCFLYGTVHGDLCPNKKDSCPASTTCCPLNDTSFGCCPYKNAQCCSDNIHCCPFGTKCDMKRQSCVSSSIGYLYKWMVPIYDQEIVTKGLSPQPTISEKEEEVVSSITCPDGNHCPKQDTCCQMPQGSYGCCPYPSATCCADRIHCCPKNFRCDTRHNRCLSKSSSANDFSFLGLDGAPLFSLTKGTFELPNKLSPCSPFAGCDLLGGYTCCTLGESKHCCPPGTACGKTKGECLKKRDPFRDSFHTNWLNSLGSHGNAIESGIFDNVCPDKTEACPSSSTCCQLPAGNYGCCPFPEATCCPDKQHCCPNGYVCGDEQCEKKPSLTPLESPAFVKWSYVLDRRP